MKMSNRCAVPLAVSPHGPDEPGARGGSVFLAVQVGKGRERVNLQLWPPRVPPAGRDEQAGPCDDLGVVGRFNAEVTAYRTPRTAVPTYKGHPADAVPKHMPEGGDVTVVVPWAQVLAQ